MIFNNFFFFVIVANDTQIYFFENLLILCFISQFSLFLIQRFFNVTIKKKLFTSLTSELGYSNL